MEEVFGQPLLVTICVLFYFVKEGYYALRKVGGEVDPKIP